MLKRMAVLSDIHGNMMALEAVVVDIKKRQVDGILNLGDHLSGPLWPRETIQYLMQQDWIQIAGNHDRRLAFQNPQDHGPSDRYACQFLSERERDWLGTLPATLRLENEHLLFHGTPTSDTTYLLETIEQRPHPPGSARRNQVALGRNKLACHALRPFAPTQSDFNAW